MPADGSSPRVRGTLPRTAASPSANRFIPAGAGNTVAAQHTHWQDAVHPRGCGEHSCSTASMADSSGSSPRVRGTLRGAFSTRRPARFIPAGAGNTHPHRSEWPTGAVHPRGCGEHPYINLGLQVAHGSSPRVRGTRGRAARSWLRLRFIPAGAGNTGVRSCGVALVAVHPRGCGEHAKLPRVKCDHCGSSPRVRGTRMPAAAVILPGRFIPAGAGNTAGRLGLGGDNTVHPRGCGEHVSGGSFFHNQPGSSPRVRGTLLCGRKTASSARFIPAGAGNTLPSRCQSRLPTVHPRGCGEHQGEPKFLRINIGSSPRVRGTHVYHSG